MATLKETAQAYEPQQTKNIADLERVPTNLQLHEEIAKAGTPDEFKYKYIMWKNEKYRVPNVVIGGIKALLTKFPDLDYVQVIRSGTGQQTRYQVIPVNAPNQAEIDEININ